MPRPRKCRRVCALPAVEGLTPIGADDLTADCPRHVVMTVEEYETVRLLDLESLTQEACAVQMGVARTTVTAIYASARQKLAQALVEGRSLLIAGGDFIVCERDACCGLAVDCPRRSPIQPKGEKTMKIAVTYENGQVFGHFGHTAQFKLYEAADGAVTASEVVDTNGSGHGALAGFLRTHGVDTLICGGIGGGAKQALADAGIQLYGGVTGDADEAVAALLNGTLRYNAAVECHHHDHAHHGDCGSGGCAHGNCGR